MSINNKVSLSNRQIIKDFFNDYPNGQHFDLLYDVISICALDEKSGISDNRKHSLVSFLERCSKLFLTVQPDQTSYQTHHTNNPKRNKKPEEDIAPLYEPFLGKVPSLENIESRANYDEYIDFKIVKRLSTKHLEIDDIAARFFIRYGLKEAFDLLTDINKETSYKKELAKFNNDLRHLLFALYIVSKENQPIKQKGDSYAK